MSMTPEEPGGWFNPETGDWDRPEPSRLSTDGPTETVRPYGEPGGGRTSGWSGSDTSHERAIERDTTGKTRKTQRKVWIYIAQRGAQGATVAEVRAAFPEDHHGTLSGALSVLHREEHLLRLRERREKCAIYVIPRFLLGREAVAHRSNAVRNEIVVTADMNAERIGHLVLAALHEHDKVGVRVGP